MSDRSYFDKDRVGAGAQETALDASTARELTVRIHALSRKGATDLAASSLEIPIGYYRDPSLWQWERDELLRNTPIVVAPSTQVARPGDYHVRELLSVSVLTTRDRHGRARVFLNYCRHRGARIADGSGNCRNFVCPYHNWTYGCDGQLVGRPRAEAFDDLPVGDHGLIELPSEERHGLIWCVLDSTGRIDLDTHLGQLAPELDEWAYANCTYLNHCDVEVAANWKAGLENFADFYHVPFIHNSLERAHVGDSAAFDAFGQHHRLLSGVGSLLDLSEEAAQHVNDDAHLVLAYWVYPNLVIIHSSLTINFIQFLPGAQPDRCNMRHTALARRTQLSDAEREGYAGIWAMMNSVFVDEDGAALERAGDGLAHSGADSVLIGRNEPGVQNMIRTLSAAAQARDA